MQHCFEMLHCGDRYGLIDGDEVDLHESHEFCEELFNECPNHVSLNGYFQSEKYFKNAEKLIRLDFRFKKHIIKEVESHFKQYLDQKPVCILVEISIQSLIIQTVRTIISMFLLISMRKQLNT